ncbi:MAG: electron transfer flavoprotein subunit alpha/FixB family protein [Spirochaetes bacterium]|nr:electron transfer flavoprotein subunit alpha/FixB family protein [Spirochaetota bacterium]
MNSGNDILVYAELTGKAGIDQVSLECLGIGRTLADKTGCRLTAVLIGSEISAAADELAHYPVDEIFTADSPALKHYIPELYQHVMKNLFLKMKPRAIIFGNTLAGLDLAPRLSFDLGAGLVTDCIALAFENGRLVPTKPVYSGNVMAEYRIESDLAIVTVRARSQDPAERRESAAAKIVPVPELIVESDTVVKVLERVVAENEGPQLEDADIIVAGGRGIGSKEGFRILSDLAKTIGAVVGASRPPCDLGWVDSNAQVGQTGEIVRPSVYFAVGISGSTQHIVGMSGSRTIIAINKDAQAPIFDIADYGIIGNYEEIIPAFSHAIIASN